jgi:hypothetical protein
MRSFRALLLVAFCAALSCRKTESVQHVDETRTKAKPLSFAYFRALGEGKEPFGVQSLEKAEAEKGWHWRLGTRDGVLVQAENVTPSGKTHQLRTYDRKSGRLETTLGDAHGETIATVVLADDGTLTRTARSGVVGDQGCHHQLVSFDAAGRVVQVSCLDEAGHPVGDEDGCEVTRRTLDDEGRIVLRACLDTKGAPAQFANGDHRRRSSFDAKGRLVLVEALDADGKPVIGLDGCAKKRTTYDAHSSRIAIACLDAADALVRETRFSVDDNGCDLREEKLDSAGAPESLDGFAIRIWHRSSICDATSEEKRDGKGVLVGDVPTHLYAYDVHGWVEEENCNDVSGKPTSCQFGRDPAGAKVKNERDDRGRVTKRRAFTSDGVPSKASASYPHEFRFTYGNDGRLAAVAYFDEAGKPGLGNGIHRILFEYDGIGAEISRKFFDRDGNPMSTAMGCHEFHTTYGDHHLFASRDCRDTFGALHAHAGCLDFICWSGAAKIVVERTPGETFDVFQDETGKELRRISCSREKCYR